jgi:short-subunit dehydrogenase
LTFVVVGASAGLGRALSESLAGRGRSLLLVASDERDLLPLAADLRLTRGVEVRVVAHDAADHAGLAAAVEAALPPDEPVDALLFPIGTSEEDDEGLLPPARAQALVHINLLAVTSVGARLLPRMIARGRGAVVGFGSVAAERGRGRNVVYAAAKRALESAFESWRHRLEPQGLSVVFYTLGYVDTNLAFGRPLPFPKADPRRIAERVCDELGGVRGKHFLPGGWRFVAFAVRALPWFLYRRARF